MDAKRVIKITHVEIVNGQRTERELSKEEVQQWVEEHMTPPIVENEETANG